ncbi:MAG: GntR family transcriptional regulator, partial [Deltaproteobacteria bacterium]|nr:GntR family transcriptional regulator [Deltaproteobacteria bacterium]
TGQYEPGTKLASEENIAKEFGVSRITIRQAFAQLEQDRLITRQRGKGTFVTKNIIPVFLQENLTSMQDMVQFVVDSKVEPINMRAIKVRESRNPKEIRDFFRLSEEDEIGQILRTIMQDDTRLHLVENYLPIDLFEKITPKEFRQKKAVMRILSKKMDIKLGEAEAFIEALVADQEIADILGCQTMEPFLCERFYLRFASGKPFEMVNYYMRGDRYKLRFDINTDNFDFSSFEDK